MDPRSDRGVTLTELVVYVFVLGIVMIVLVGVFMSVNNAQKTVTGVTGASNQGQAAANQIASAVSNASALKLIVPKSGDQLLLTRTAKPGATASWICEGWYYESAANAVNGVGSIRFQMSTTAIPTPTQAALTSSWASIATGITPVSGSTIFNAPLNTGAATIVTFSFNATVTGQKPQLISTSSTTPLGNTGSSPCF
jgi:Tfp pilus assembly protein FimT